MDHEQSAVSRFWSWHREKYQEYFDRAGSLHDEGLELIVEAVNSGGLTCLDSVESPLTKRIQDFHGIKNFETNDNWLGSSQEWVCPACSRDKFQISRVGKKEQILAKLVVHHDHMGDLLDEAFHSTFARLGAEDVQTAGRKLIDRIAKAFAAHDNVLVCEDCNTADVEAKKIVDAPKYFSFTLSQIKQFVLPRAHSSHLVDSDRVKAIWEVARPVFELRSTLINQVAQAAVTGGHWYEPFEWGHDPVPTIHEARFNSDLKNIRQWVYPNSLLARLGHQERTDNRDYSKWRTVRKKQSPVIPKNFLSILLSNTGVAKMWAGVPDNWSCPVCKRAKVEIPYVGEQSSILFNIATASRHGLWNAAPKYCGNCQTVLLGLKAELQHLLGMRFTNSYDFVSPEELARIIDPKPNRMPHVVLQGEAKQLLEQCVCRLRSSGVCNG